MIEIEQAATVSILYAALLDKKSAFCRQKMVMESKKLLACKKDVEECLERIDDIEEQLADIRAELTVEDDDEEEEMSPEIAEIYESHPEVQSLLTEKKEEEMLLAQMSKVLECRKATMRMLVKHRAILDSSRKSLRNRQRTIVEKAFRTGLLACQS
jgi:hypothetical protein